MRLRVSADERYELFLDGRRIGRGPERGTIEHWFYDSSTCRWPQALTCWSPACSRSGLSRRSRSSRCDRRSCSRRRDPRRSGSTRASRPGRRRRLPGYSVEPPVYVWGLSAPVTVDGSGFAWGFERGDGEGWRPVVAHERAVERATRVRHRAVALPAGRDAAADARPPVDAGARASRGRGALARHADDRRARGRPPRERGGCVAGPARRPRELHCSCRRTRGAA